MLTPAICKFYSISFIFYITNYFLQVIYMTTAENGQTMNVVTWRTTTTLAMEWTVEWTMTTALAEVTAAPSAGAQD
jgi:hypothetical protein